MERSLSLLTDRIEVLRAAVRRARARHPFQNIPAAEGATLFRPTVMKMCRYLCPGGEGSVVLPAGAGRFMERVGVRGLTHSLVHSFNPIMGVHRMSSTRPPRTAACRTTGAADSMEFQDRASRCKLAPVLTIARIARSRVWKLVSSGRRSARGGGS